MKTDFLKIAVVAVVLLSAVQLWAQNRDWAQHGRYAQANKELPAPAKGEHRVVFMGNSITDFWIDNRPEFWKENGYIDRGISGQTSYQFLSRFRQDVIDLKPEVVVINVGTNDCAENSHPFNPELTLGNLKSMVELAKANGIKVIVASALPATTFSWNPVIKDAPERIKTINKLIKQYVDENKLPCRLLFCNGCRSRRYHESGLQQRRRTSHQSRLCRDGADSKGRDRQNHQTQEITPSTPTKKGAPAPRRAFPIPLFL